MNKSTTAADPAKCFFPAGCPGCSNCDPFRSGDPVSVRCACGARKVNPASGLHAHGVTSCMGG